MLFGTKDEAIRKRFMEVFEQGSSVTESEFLDSLNEITTMVVKNETYSTNQKLKIYELLSQLSNCSPKERHKYAKKLMNNL
ncbi:MAG: hypothetical protein IKE51_04300 [Solobacterium sp.]|nr:hypothetical protein [Solobacterium sp.]